MEPGTFKSLSEDLYSLGSRDKLLNTLISIRDPSSLERKVQPRCCSSSGLSWHNIYPSWIDTFWINLSKFFASKMPHSNLKEILLLLNLGIGKCPCGQTFCFASERDLDMKLRMHHKFCSELVEDFKEVMIPKKAMTLRE